MTKWLNRRRMIGGLVVLLVAGAVAGGLAMRQGMKAEGDKAGPEAKGPAQPALEFTAADLTHVESLPLSRWLPVSGTLQPVKQATVKAKVSGDVRQITVREGEKVLAGQVLARIDTADLDAKLLERIGAMESAKAQLALAEKNRSTNLTLLKQNFISQNAYDNFESSFNVAQGSVKSAEAQVQIARNALRDSVVNAPMTGIIAKRHVQTGEKVAFDTPIVTVVDLGQLELQAMVPAVDIPELAIGMGVGMAVDGFGERKFGGRIERISPSTEPGTRAILVYVGIPNADQALRGGMFATGKIAIAAQAPAPTLPLSSIRTEGGQSFVWTIADGKLARRNVVLGRRDDAAGRVEIRNALSPDIPVLVAKVDNLKDGAAAIVKAPSNLPTPASAPASATKQAAG